MTTRLGIGMNIDDTRAKVRVTKLHNMGYKDITDLWILDVYTIDKKFSDKQLDEAASRLSNPVTQYSVIASEAKQSLKRSPRLRQSADPRDNNRKFAYAIEIGFLPGVTDNIAHTTKEIIEDGLKIKFSDTEGVYTSQVTFIQGNISLKDAENIALTLHNPLIQRAHIKNYKEFVEDGDMDVIVPKVKIVKKPEVSIVDLNVSDDELIKTGKSGIANEDGTRRGPLALDLTYMKTIQTYFKKLRRNPTDIELESIAQTWSEHCKHTIFADPMDGVEDGLYKTYIKRATEKIRKAKGKKDFCASVFVDNSGAIIFDNNYLVTHKVETHNSPSALDPYGGAITGIVGVNRDTIGFGLGAKPIANFYGFCLADPRVDIPLYKDEHLTQKMLSSRRIMDGVIDGVNAGGNQSGIPTPQGFVYFDERYRGKPLVFAGTIGLIPKKIKGKDSHIKKARPGDLIVMIGGRVGKDGIHGATFSSEALSGGSPATAVQIGDPITQKKLSDAVVKEARDMLLYNSITDNGAGGLSCSVAEMAKESGGCIVDLEKVPLKYAGLDPWEIWISESQERMTLAIPKLKWKKFENLMNRRGVEATAIGEFTKSGRCVVKYNKKTVMDIDLTFLHDGLPKRTLSTTYQKAFIPKKPIDEDKSLDTSLLAMLSQLNITSFEFISQQYDHIVQGNFVLGPLQGRGRINSDASIIRPLLSSQKGLVLSQALYPTLTELDAYRMSAVCIDTAIRNAVAVGANPDYLALLDNFCWCSSNESERLGQLKESCKACFDFAVSFGTPFISGKDSMFNDFKGYDQSGKPRKISIPPTLLISSIGVIDDFTKSVSLDAKLPGDVVYILGETHDELAGSEYFAMKKIHGSTVPTVDAKRNKKLYDAFYKAVQKKLIASSISIGKGGLGVALTKKAMGGKLGIDVSLKNLPGSVKRNDFALFSESQGRILVSIAPENKNAFEKIMSGNIFTPIGKITNKQNVSIKGVKGKEITNLSLEKAIKEYRKTFKDY
jgi:phosphoribosylformylglycinamidine synthase subunit PurSL